MLYNFVRDYARIVRKLVEDSKMVPRLPSGIDFFAKLVREDYLFIDHSLMIHDEWLTGKTYLTMQG